MHFGWRLGGVKPYAVRLAWKNEQASVCVGLSARVNLLGAWRKAKDLVQPIMSIVVDAANIKAVMMLFCKHAAELLKVPAHTR